MQRQILFIVAAISLLVAPFGVRAQDGSAPPADGGGTVVTDPAIPADSKAGTASDPVVKDPTAVPTETPTVIPTQIIATSSPVSSEPRPTTTSTLPEPTPSGVVPEDGVPEPIFSADAVIEVNGQNDAAATNNYWYLGGIVALLAGAGVYLRRGRTNNQHEKKDHCTVLKRAWEEKEKGLVGVRAQFSLQEAAVRELEYLAEQKKQELASRAKKVAIDAVVKLDETGKAKHVADTVVAYEKAYEDTKKKLAEARSLIEALSSQLNALRAEANSAESAYNACIAGTIGARKVRAGGKPSPVVSGTNVKHIKFRDFKADMIQRGEKTASIRLFDDKDLQKGDALELLNWDTGKVFARGTITEVLVKKLRDISGADLHGHELYESTEAMIESMRVYYGDRVTSETDAKIVRFSVDEILNGD